jgi:hypothetical protein
MSSRGWHSQDTTRGRAAAAVCAWRILFFGFAVFAAAAPLGAQELEPRSYVNTPVGMNFLIAGYTHTDGKMAFDESSSITDASFKAHTSVFAYARSLDIFGQSGKFDVILPYSWLSAEGNVAGQARERQIDGFNDPRFRLSVNFFGAPALSVKEFANYKQDLIIGASVQVSAPLGQYDATRLVNIGTNRWSVKSELGISKAFGPWTIEIAPSIIVFTDNTNFYNGNTLARAPFYVVQAHLLHSFPNGVWIALDGTYFTGGRTTLNGVKDDNMQTNTRAGITLAIPVDRGNSLKLYASTGTSTRTGTEFTALGMAWQYRWGEGY